MDSHFCDDRLNRYSDMELIERIVSSPFLTPASRISLLSSNFLAKHHQPSEVEDVRKATEVAYELGIPAPSIQRTVIHQLHAHCIMNRIEGTTLDLVWTKLSWFMTFKLGLQLRRFVGRLRSITSSTAGSLATGECRSFWLEDRYGLPPRSGPANLAHFFRFWCSFTSMRKAMKAAQQGQMQTSTDQTPRTTEKFVFTHHDLAPRNLLLSPSGQLWLLDWDLAGFYPIYFEYASMYNFNMPENWGFFDRLRWRLFTWIAVGYYERDAQMLRNMRSRFTRFPNGRRFELMKNGGPYRYPVS